MSQTTAPAAAASRTWIPIVAGCYALCITAAVMLVAAGFESVDEAVRSIGSATPFGDEVGSFVGVCLVAMMALLGAVPLARRAVGRATEAGIATHAFAVGITALVLAFPPAHWVLFGRPEPSTAHEHSGHMVAHPEAKTPTVDACAATGGAQSDSCPTEPAHEVAEDHADHDH